MANSHSIQVTIAGGRPSVKPEECTVKVGDDVSWVGTGPETFHIAFASDSPLDSTKLDHRRASRPNRVQQGIKGKHYHYSVVPDGNSGNALDPVIIIEDPTKGVSGP